MVRDATNKSEDPESRRYQSVVDFQQGRMSLKNSGTVSSAKTTEMRDSAETTRKSPMPAMPSMKSLIFKEEKVTIGFWPGCQAPDLKEVLTFLSSLLNCLGIFFGLS